MKLKFIFLAYLLSFLTLTKVYCREHTLFNNNTTTYTIVIPSNATASEKYAADELQYWLKKIGGVLIPIQQGYGEYISPKLSISKQTQIFRSQTEGSQLQMGNNSYTYYSNEDDIFFIGSDELGVIYCIYSFLENEFSCRWYGEDLVISPQKSQYSFSSLSYYSSPVFSTRKLYYKNAFNNDWALRNKINGLARYTDSSYGSIRIFGETFCGVHTFNKFVPPDKYYDSHPEYYSLVDGERIPTQLCLSNADVIKICTEELRTLIKKEPAYKYYDLSQNDNLQPCQCDKCRRLVKKEGSESGPILFFVNKVSQSLQKEFPNKYISTLAYQYSQKPPKHIIPNKNVAIRLCPINTCLIHDFNCCSSNKAFARDLKKWKQITDNLFIWDYIGSTRMYYAPLPNFDAIQQRLIYYKENGIKGVNLEGASKVNGDLTDLRAYIISKLLWNPLTEIEPTILQFMKDVYGESASEMYNYYTLSQSLSHKNKHLFFVFDQNNDIYDRAYISEALNLLETALTKTDNPKIENLINQQRFVVSYLYCKKYPEEAIKTGYYKFVNKWQKDNSIESFAGSGKQVSVDDFYQEMQRYIVN